MRQVRCRPDEEGVGPLAQDTDLSTSPEAETISCWRRLVAGSDLSGRHGHVAQDDDSFIRSCLGRRACPERRLSEADKRQILEQAILPDACFAKVARRYGIAERVLFRWKQEATQAAAPMFVAVEVADGPLDATLGNEEHAS